MSTQSYSFITEVSLFGEIVLRSTSPTKSTTLTDDQDGSADGAVANGDDIKFVNPDGFTRTGAVAGTTDNGVVIEFTNFQGTKHYLATNTAYPVGSSLQNFDSTGSVAYCFLEGTEISTPNGNVPIETIKRGDKVLTAEGKAVTVKWMGYQTIHNRIATPSSKEPVKITANAFGNGLPKTDLFVTGSHGILIDGMLINASALCNGSSIDFVPLSEMPDVFTYWHIETDNHEAVVANGVAAETFVDAPDRRSFDNYQEYVDFFGAERVIPEMNLPRVTEPEHLPEAIRLQLDISVENTDWASLAQSSTSKLSLKRSA